MSLIRTPLGIDLTLPHAGECVFLPPFDLRRHDGGRVFYDRVSKTAPNGEIEGGSRASRHAVHRFCNCAISTSGAPRITVLGLQLFAAAVNGEGFVGATIGLVDPGWTHKRAVLGRLAPCDAATN